jgi:hypothetical protein
MERFRTIVGILLALGIIFGTFSQWQAGILFGWQWFVNLLWFVIGFPVLFGLGWTIFSLMILGETEVKKASIKKAKEE